MNAIDNLERRARAWEINEDKPVTMALLIEWINQSRLACPVAAEPAIVAAPIEQTWYEQDTSGGCTGHQPAQSVADEPANPEGEVVNWPCELSGDDWEWECVWDGEWRACKVYTTESVSWPLKVEVRDGNHIGVYTGIACAGRPGPFRKKKRLHPAATPQPEGETDGELDRLTLENNRYADQLAYTESKCKQHRDSIDGLNEELRSLRSQLTAAQSARDSLAARLAEAERYERAVRRIAGPCEVTWMGYAEGFSCIDVKRVAIEDADRYVENYRQELISEKHFCRRCIATNALAPSPPATERPALADRAGRGAT